MKETLKKIAKSSMAILSIVGIVMIATRLVNDLYDFRLILAASGGAFLYEPLRTLFDKIKSLE